LKFEALIPEAWRLDTLLKVPKVSAGIVLLPVGWMPRKDPDAITGLEC